MTTINGNCTLSGSAISGAEVYIVDPEDMTVLASTTSDSNGDWSTEIVGGQTVHAIAQYEDGAGDQYNTLSQPYIYVPVTTTYIENFESSNPLSNYSGDTGSFTIDSNITHSGTGALQGTGFTAKITSSSGLDNYPAKGDEFEWYWLAETVDTSYAQGRTFWGSSADNYIGADISWETDDHYIQLYRWEGSNTGTASDLLSFTAQANTWYRCHVTWDDGTTFGGADGEFTFTMEDANSTDTATCSFTDATLSSGVFGFYTDNNQDMHWDDVILL